jgi:hypothetical protein
MVAAGASGETPRLPVPPGHCIRNKYTRNKYIYSRGDLWVDPNP